MRNKIQEIQEINKKGDLNIMSNDKAKYIVSPEQEKIEKIQEVQQQAIQLRKAIKSNERDIDNPSLVLGILSELDFFIENVEED